MEDEHNANEYESRYAKNCQYDRKGITLQSRCQVYCYVLDLIVIHDHDAHAKHQNQLHEKRQ
jgi:hypothetical protein